jgi:hypothetical protein
VPRLWRRLGSPYLKNPMTRARTVFEIHRIPIMRAKKRSVRGSHSASSFSSAASHRATSFSNVRRRMPGAGQGVPSSSHHRRRSILSFAGWALSSADMRCEAKPRRYAHRDRNRRPPLGRNNLNARSPLAGHSHRKREPPIGPGGGCVRAHRRTEIPDRRSWYRIWSAQAPNARPQTLESPGYPPCGTVK